MTTMNDQVERLMRLLSDSGAEFNALDFSTAASHHVYWAARARRFDPREAIEFREEAHERALDELAEVVALTLLAARELNASLDDLVERAITGWEYRLERRPS